MPLWNVLHPHVSPASNVKNIIARPHTSVAKVGASSLEFVTVLQGLPPDVVRRIFVRDVESFMALQVNRSMCEMLSDPYYYANLGYRNYAEIARHRTFDIRVSHEAIEKMGGAIFLEVANSYISGYIDRRCALRLIEFLQKPVREQFLDDIKNCIPSVPEEHHSLVGVWSVIGLANGLIDSDDFKYMKYCSINTKFLDICLPGWRDEYGRGESILISRSDCARVGLLSTHIDADTLRFSPYAARFHYLVRAASARRSGRWFGPLGPYTTNSEALSACMRLFEPPPPSAAINMETPPRRVKERAKRDVGCAII